MDGSDLIGPWSFSEKHELKNQREHEGPSAGLSNACEIPASFTLKGVPLPWAGQLGALD